MIRVAEGKYRIGDTQVLIFVRILRNHVMVRVGGGWDTLQHYLDKHDPCRCKQGHRQTVGAHVTMKTGGKGLMNVCYDRLDSPSTPRRRSSANGSASTGRRSSSQNPDPKSQPGNNLFATPLNSSSTPRGSIGNIAARGRSTSNHQIGQKPPAPIQSKISLGRGTTPTPLVYSRSKSPSQSGSDYLDGAKHHSNLVFKSDGPINKSNLLDVEGKKAARDTLSTCDSGSEVSDEGYKSSQGCNSSGVNTSDLMHLDSKKRDDTSMDNINDRPDSSLTVTSECSSTISSEDDPAEVTHLENTIHRNKKVENEEQNVSEPPPASPTGSSISDELNWPPPPPPLASTPANTTATTGGNTSPSKNNRLSSLFSNMKIPKLKFARKNSTTNSNNSVNKSIDIDDEDKTLSPVEAISPTRSENACTKTPQQRFSRSMSVGSEDGGLLGNFSRSGVERRSYRAPTATSRYMQAAEAYAAKKRTDRSGCPSPTGSSGVSSSRNGTWTSSTLGRRGRERSAITANTFLPPSRTPSRNGTTRPSSRTASASPGPYRKRTPSGGNYFQHYEDESGLPVNNGADFPTSTHSTPARKPGRTNGVSSSLNKSTLGYDHMLTRPVKGVAKTSKSSHALADLDNGEDNQILKQMEEILLTYKARVETHLAAEGRELPKEIFEDFTTQWVATCKTPSGAKSVSNGNLLIREPSQSKLFATPRKDPLQGQEKRSRIPMPTFYNSPIPSETNI